jgi:hypothetical protein
MIGIDILRSRLKKAKVFQMRQQIGGEEFYKNVDMLMLNISIAE